MRDIQAHFTTQRPVAVIMVFLALAVFGIFSLVRLPITLMPGLSYPTLTVRTEYPGAAPEEVENDISRPIEEALGVIGGLNKISSVSRSGASDVVLEFVWGTDMGEATQNVLEKLDLVFLPDEAKRPLILHFDPSLDPIMELSFAGSGNQFNGEEGLRRLRRIAELQIKRELEPVKGVAAVRIRGGLEEEIHVLLDEEALRRAKIGINDVIQRLSQENINVAGGTIKEGNSEYMVRTLNEYEDLEQIRRTIVTRVEDRPIRIADLGSVERAHREREILTQTNGEESVLIEIYKEADANMVSLAKAIKAMVGSYEAKPEPVAKTKDEEKAPKGILSKRDSLAQRVFESEGAKLQVIADRSLFIESSINEVRNTALIGGFLAILVLFLFLRSLKATLIIGVSIPVSIAMTFAPLHLAEVSLNIMSLGGLALGIGMLVDSSIVVLESIYRCSEEGDGIIEAAIRGTAEVRGAVFASTLTSIAVFFPMVFVEGIAGQIFGDLGLAVVTSLSASLLVAVFLIPMLASRTAPNQAGKTWQGAGLLRKFHSLATLRQSLAATKGVMKLIAMPYFVLRFVLSMLLELVGKLLLGLIAGILYLLLGLIWPLLTKIGKTVAWLPLKVLDKLLTLTQRSYAGTIRWVLRHPLPVLLLFAGCLYLTWEVGRRLESELLPEVHQGEFTFEASLPVGTPLQETLELLTPLEAAILAEKEHIKDVLVTFGYDVNQTDRSDEGEHTAKFKILLESTPDMKATEEAVIDRLRGRFTKIPGLDYRVTRPVLFSAATPIEVEIHGTDLKALRTYSDQARDLLASLPELSDVEATLKRGAPEIQIRYDREKMMRYGLNLDQVAKLVRAKVKGEEATKFNLKDRRVPILVRLNEEYRANVEDVSGITINPGGNFPIPLDAVADLFLDEGPSEVRRIDGSRVALIRANTGAASLGTAVNRIRETLQQDIQWSTDTSFFITGQSEEWERSRTSLFLALFLSIFLVYVIMASQFESLLYPLIIMFTIPLAFLGSLVGLYLLGIHLSVVVFLGMIMLAGIVVNNAIVLVDYVNTLKERGLTTFDAVVTAGSVRLRPILMTTATTVLGLLPMALGLGDGAEIRTPMAIAVICGLISSTFLTLLIVPAAYYQLDRLGRFFGRNTQKATPAEPAEGIVEAIP